MTPRPRSAQGASHPPRFAEWLLAALIRDGQWRDSIVGDLREEFARFHAAHGPQAARRWYWRQALAIGGSSLWYLPGLIVLLAAVALTAAYFPARRAAAIDPTAALRAE